MLLNNTDELKTFVAVSEQLSWDGIEPYVKIAEMNYLKPLIKDELYTRLNDYLEQGSAAESGDDDAAAVSQALYFARKSVANIAVWEGFTIISANFSNKGARRTESEDHKSQFKYQEDEFKDRLLNNGHNALDELLTYLEDNIEYFPEFEETETYTNLKVSVIKDTKTFDSIYDISSSRLVFLKLKRFITQSLDLDIKKVLGADLYDEIITELAKDSPAAKVTNLVPYVQKPLVFYSIARGIDELGYNITDKGIVFMKGTSYLDGMIKEQKATGDVMMIAHKARTTGDHYLELLKQFLIANASTYTTYSGQSGTVFKRDNTGKKTVWK